MKVIDLREYDCSAQFASAAACSGYAHMPAGGAIASSVGWGLIRPHVGRLELFGKLDCVRERDGQKDLAGVVLNIDAVP